ncbi:MAG: hypothetical protein SV862_13080, partial [Pseudomonadota bacterium]|nr:hypothetical protein [Pseudomonadota bacterium]
MASHGIEIRGLYKIFGPRGQDHVAQVRGGMSKTSAVVLRTAPAKLSRNPLKLVFSWTSDCRATTRPKILN